MVKISGNGLKYQTFILEKAKNAKDLKIDGEYYADLSLMFPSFCEKCDHNDAKKARCTEELNNKRKRYARTQSTSNKERSISERLTLGMNLVFRRVIRDLIDSKRIVCIKEKNKYAYIRLAHPGEKIEKKKRVNVCKAIKQCFTEKGTKLPGGRFSLHEADLQDNILPLVNNDLKRYRFLLEPLISRWKVVNRDANNPAVLIYKPEKFSESIRKKIEEKSIKENNEQH